MYSSVDDPPKTSMSVWAGGGSPPKKGKKNEVTQALSEVVTAFKGVVSPNMQASSSSVSSSSVIESRSMLYKQLSELRELQNVGVLTTDEYQPEKDSIMKLLLQLKW